MIESTDEFVRLRTSEIQEEYHRAAHEEASDEVWWDVIHRYPDMIKWVIHNKTVPLSILDHFSTSSNPTLRWEVACKRKLSYAVFQRLANDEDEAVRIAIVCNKKVPLDILDHLTHDQSAEVAEVARARLDERHMTMRKKAGNDN